MQSKVQEIIQTKEYTNMLENQRALDCIAIAIVSAEDYWTLVATCCNVIPTYSNIHVFMMSQ